MPLNGNIYDAFRQPWGGASNWDLVLLGDDSGQVLTGGAGRDWIYGAGGDDEIFGGAGADLLIGGDGADRFVYLRPEEISPWAVDTILDFEQGVDKIDVSALVRNYGLTWTGQSASHHGAWFGQLGGMTVIFLDFLGTPGSPAGMIRLNGRYELGMSDFIGFNVPPVLSGDLQGTVAEGGAYAIVTPADLGWVDPDDVGADITFTASAFVNGKVQVGGIDDSTFTGAELQANLVTFIHDGSETTTASFKVVVEDQNEDASDPLATKGASGTFMLTVTPVNDAPTLTAGAKASYTEDAPAVVVDGSLVAGDVDDTNLESAKVWISAGMDAGDRLNFVNQSGITGSYNGATGELTLSGSATLAQYQAALRSVTFDSTNQDPGPSRVISWRVNDGDADSAVATSTIAVTAVNDAPVAVADSATVDEGGTVTKLTGGATSVLANDSDAENDSLGAILVTGPANGSLTLNPDGTFSYLHDGGETTVDNFSYKVNDGKVDGNTVTVSLAITPVNDAPVNTWPAGPRPAVEDQVFVVNAGQAKGAQIGVFDADAGSSPLKVTLSATHGTLTLGALSGLSFNAGDGTADASMEFTGTQTNINAALLALTFSPDANYWGDAKLTLVTDDLGASGTGGAKSDTDVMTLNIAAVNDVPVAVADSATVAEGGKATTLDGGATSVLANDNDVDGDTLSALLVTGPAHGGLTLNPDGTFSYQHDGSETTADSFTYTVNDGTVGGNTVTVSLAITPVNDAPVAVGDSATVDEGGTVTKLTGGAVSVLANDSDAENSALSAILVTGPAHGSLTLNPDGTFSYQHDGSETTADSFTYKANDGTVGGNTVTVNLAITAVNDAPVNNWPAGPRAAFEDTPFALGAGLAKGASIGVFDVDAGASPLKVNLNASVGSLTLSTLSGLSSITGNGTAALAFTGSQTDINAAIAAMVYTPPGDFSGDVTLTILTDDQGATGTGGSKTDTDVMSIQVAPVNDAPVLVDVALSLSAVAEDAPAPTGAVGTLVSSLVDFIGGGGLNNVADADAGAALGIALTGTDTANGGWFYSTNGGASWQAVGAVSDTSALLLAADAGSRLYFQPSANFNGTLSSAITFRAWDQTSGSAGSKANTSPSGGATAFSSATDTASLTVTSVNDNPDAIDDPGVSVAEDAAATAINVLANDLIAPDTGETLSITAVTQPANGTVVITGGGTGLTYQPNPNFNGPTSFTYTIGDGNGGTDTATVSVNVTAVNDAPVLDASKSPAMQAVLENSGAPSGAVGTLVSSLMDFASPAGQVDNVSDVDASPLLGMALTGTDTANGSWFYSTNGGTSWQAVEAVSDAAALLLVADASTRLYFQPTNGFDGAVPNAITFRAWDRTSGTAGTQANASLNGGTSAFSSSADTASLSVTPLNDAPTLADTAVALSSVAEDAPGPVGAVGTLVSSLVDFPGGGGLDNVTDPNVGALLGIALTGTDTANGSWFYSTNGGASWQAVGAVSDASALLLAADAGSRLYFQPSANFNGTVPGAITFRAWDQTSGSAGSTANTSPNGGSTAFSVASDTASLTVTSVNDNPDAINDTGITVAEDAPATAINVLANDLIAPDTGETLKITSVTQPANGAVVITGGGTGLTYQPLSNFNGPTSFTYTISDGNGGTDTATVSVNVTPVNDAPIVTAGNTASYTENGAGTALSPSLVLSDIENDTITGAKISISTNFALGQDVLAFTNQLGITGSYASGTGVLTLTGTTSVANYQTALRSITYANSSEAPSTAARTISYQVTDSPGDTNSTASSTMNVTAVNDAPTNTVPSNASVGTAFSNTALAISGLSIADVDAGSSTMTANLTAANGGLTFSLVGGATVSAGTNGSGNVTLSGSQSQINLALATLSYKSNDGYVGKDTIQIVTDDGGATGGAAQTDTDSFQVGVVPQVFFIDNLDGTADTAASGTSADPFNSIASFNSLAVDSANDYIYIRKGGSTYSETGGFILLNGQQVYGAGQSLSFTNPVTSAVVNIATGVLADAPTLSVTGASINGVTLAQDNKLTGFNIATTLASQTGIADGAGTVGSLTISDMDVTGVGMAVDIDQGGALSVAFDTLSSSGSSQQGVQLAATGTALSGSFTATGGAIGGSTATAFLVGDGSGTANTGGTVAISYGGSVASTGTARTVDIQDRASGASAITLSGNVTHSGGNGTAVFIDDIAAGAITLGGTGTYNTGTAAAVQVTDVSGGSVTFSGNLDIDTTSGTGISLGTNSAATSFTGAQITVNTTTGAGVNIAGNSGSVSFNTATGNGLDIVTTEGGTGLAASGSGTVTIQGASNSISSTNAAAINVANTTIGASGLNFVSVASSGAANGIVLNATGSTGSLTVTGTGSANTGGTISGATGNGIDVTSGMINLGYMQVKNAAGHGIDLLNLLGTGNTISNTTITGFDSGGANTENGLNWLSTGITAGGLTVSNSTFSAGSAGNEGIFVEAQSSGAMTLTVTGSTFTGLFGDAIQASGITGATSTMRLTVANSTFSTAVATTGNGGLSITPFGDVTLYADINNNSFSDIMRPVTNLGAIGITNGGTADADITIRNNTLNNIVGARGITITADGGTTDLLIDNNNVDNLGSTSKPAINVNFTNNSTLSTVATGNVTVSNNDIGQSGTVPGNLWTGGSGTANAILLQTLNGASMTAAITNNIVDANTTSVIEVIRVRAAAATGFGGGTINVTVSGNNSQDTDTGSGNVPFDATAGTSTLGGTVNISISGNTLNSGSLKLTENAAGTINVTQASNSATSTANGNATVVETGPPTYGAAAPSSPTTPSLPLLALHADADQEVSLQQALHLTSGQLDLLGQYVAAAVARWTHAGVDAAVLAQLDGLTVGVAEIDGPALALAQGGTIWLDIDAGGHGWYLDATPLDDSEYVAAGPGRLVANGGEAATRFDLVTALMHEIGHVLGLSDVYGDPAAPSLMSGWLNLGERLLPVGAGLELVGVQPIEALGPMGG